MNERRSNRRIRLLLGVFALVFAGTLGRAVWLQGVQASTLEQMASRQHQATTAIPAGRGTIFDRTGEPLAIGEQATTIYADPRSVKQPRRVALAAAKALGLNAETLYPLLADHSRHFVYVKRKADPAKAAELEKLKLPGLGFYAEELRYYPQRSVAAHVLGYAGIDNKGLEGLERSRRGEQPAVQREQIRLGERAFVRDRHAQEHLAFALDVPDRSIARSALGPAGVACQFGTLVQDRHQPAVEGIDLLAQAAQLGRLEGLGSPGRPVRHARHRTYGRSSRGPGDSRAPPGRRSTRARRRAGS
jgi:cell division protein FtsI (penicillin-binding protein 3)